MGVGCELHGVDHSDHHDHAAIGCLPISMEDSIGRPKEDCTKVQGYQKGREKLWPPTTRLDSLPQVGWGDILLVCCDGGLQDKDDFA